MSYNYTDKKLTAVLASNLDLGVALNVMGHLSIAITAHVEKSELMGRDLLYDASGEAHLGISKYPVIITKIRPGKLKKLIIEARQRDDVIIADYPEQMLTTGHDDELAAELLKMPFENLNYLGAILYGSTPTIQQLTGRFELWR